MALWQKFGAHGAGHDAGRPVGGGRRRRRSALCRMLPGVPSFGRKRPPGAVYAALMRNVPLTLKRRHSAPLGENRRAGNEAGRPVIGGGRWWRWSAKVSSFQRSMPLRRCWFYCHVFHLDQVQHLVVGDLCYQNHSLESACYEGCEVVAGAVGDASLVCTYSSALATRRFAAARRLASSLGLRFR